MVDLGPLCACGYACGFPDEPCSTCESMRFPEEHEALGPGDGAREPVAEAEPKLVEIRISPPKHRCCYKSGCGPNCW